MSSKERRLYGLCEATLILHVTVCNSVLEVGSALAWGAWAGCFGAATVVYNNGLSFCTNAYNECNRIINSE